MGLWKQKWFFEYKNLLYVSICLNKKFSRWSKRWPKFIPKRWVGHLTNLWFRVRRTHRLTSRLAGSWKLKYFFESVFFQKKTSFRWHSAKLFNPTFIHHPNISGKGLSYWPQVGCIFRSTPPLSPRCWLVTTRIITIFRIGNRNLHLQLLLRVDLRCISFPSIRSPVATGVRRELQAPPTIPPKKQSRLIPNLSSPRQKKMVEKNPPAKNSHC